MTETILTTSPEMRLYSAEGDRLYLNQAERKAFLEAANEEPPVIRMLCHVLHDTGCRPSEALELFPDRINFEGTITFRTLKKRKFDGKGRVKLPQYRAVPVSTRLIENLDLVFNLRQIKQGSELGKEKIWPFARTTAYHHIKRVMTRAKIEGKQATAKGLRHGFGVAMATAKNPIPIHLLAKALGHSSTSTTEIYLTIIGKEERGLFLSAWED